MIEVFKSDSEFITQFLSSANKFTQTQFHGVRVTHIPSGFYAECSIYKSGHKNKQECIDAINNKLGKQNDK